MISRTSRRLVCALGLVGAGVLLAAWSLAVPVFEAPDEPAHWQYARFLHDHWGRGDLRLPRYEAGFEEANSPPLAYALLAPVARPSPVPDAAMGVDARRAPAPFWPPRYFYNTDRDLQQYRPLRLARLVNVALAIVTVFVAGLIGRATTGRLETGFLTAGILLLWPQFTFRSGTVSNDTLVTLFAALVTLGCVRLTREGFTWTRGAWTGIALAAAYLTKINAIALVVPTAFALLAAPGTDRPRLRRLGAIGLALAIALPWSLRNVTLYGDPFASGAMHTAVSHIIEERSLLSWYFVWDFPRLLTISFIGLFGWANVRLPEWLYVLYGVGALAAGAGLARGFHVRTLDRRLAALLVLAVLAALAVVVRINLQFTQPQGRYLFPALPAMATLFALSLSGLPERWARPIPILVVCLLAAGNLYALAGILRPAYYPAVAHDVSPDIRRVEFAAASGMTWDAGAREFLVTGDDAWWQVPLDEAAADVSAVTLVVRSSAAPAERRGCLAFATDRAPLARNPPICFDWRADGSPQRIVVETAGRSGWSGRLTHLRALLFHDGPAAGARVAIDEWTLHRARPT